MEFVKSKLEGAWLVRPRVFRDDRGFFLETFKAESFADHGISTSFVQDNHSRSLRRGVLRGMHFQRPPHTQAKLVRAARGAIYDVIVDLRRGSPTFGQWEGFTLDDTDLAMLYVPRGFAHGFCTLTDAADVVYKADDYYASDCEGGVLWSDPDMKIEWPITAPLLSDKDRELPRLAQFDSPFRYA